ncbi:trichohyalin isoform X2 [Impatiens glandulifera]|uniref:trichohyalin isoform X2 n=1 Tax=Impatiens glandulifera TaxID=253017 RepID=UPI001FB0C412|nr:trichohyalin isoform X2 [Impatiens glandulifera]
MAKVQENPHTPVASRPISDPEKEVPIVSSASPPNPDANEAASKSKPCPSLDFIASAAAKIASQPLQNSDPDVWGVLTAISVSARKRHQGMNMLLTSEEHNIGRMVDDLRFQIDANSVSAKHCRIYRKRVDNENHSESSSTSCMAAFLKDNSTNGTYLNSSKLKKTSPETTLRHGDIISLVAPPQHEQAFAFVFREVLRSNSSGNGLNLKRKSEEHGSESKRVKGIGIGAPEGPISLDDFRSLQRSNTELRTQLESQVITIESLRNENRAATERHEHEMNDLKATVSNSFVDQLKELQNSLEIKHKELSEIQRISAEQKHGMEDLNKRLESSMQSCAEAKEIINSQNASISELKAQLYEEREQRKEEREKAGADLKESIQRVQAEAQVEIKRVSEAFSKREKDQQELINKLQELEKERCFLVETLRSKLDDTRDKLVISENKVRQLEAQLCEEQEVSANGKNKIEELELEIKRLTQELENEKSAREEAWAKVSALELEINDAMKDLDYERRGLKAARERIMLRETQLRAFYSTTEEISVLFARQQEQLKAMQRTLEDEDNYDNTFLDIDLNRPMNIKGEVLTKGPIISRRPVRDVSDTSTDGVSETEKHDCENRSQEYQNTQEAEFTSGEQQQKEGEGFGSEIEPIPIVDLTGTERVLDTESQVGLNQLDDDDRDRITNSVSKRDIEIETQNMEDTEMTVGIIIQTADLVTSEVAGSWAYSTAPSMHDQILAVDSHESQTTPVSEILANKRNLERQALSQMIGIVAPDMEEEFAGAAKREDGDKAVDSNSDTEDYTDGEENKEDDDGVERGMKEDDGVERGMEEDDDGVERGMEEDDGVERMDEDEEDTEEEEED